MVQTVGAYHPLRTTRLDLSVTTDDVVVADTKLVMSITAVPGVDLSSRGCLVGPYCRTMNNQQCNCSHKANHYYAQLIVASAVAIDVAIVATHLKIEIKTFLVTFILHFFTFLPFYLFTFKSVSFARYG